MTNALKTLWYAAFHSPLVTVANKVSTVPPTSERWMIKWNRKTIVLGENLVPVPLCPKHLRYGLLQEQTWPSAVRSLALITPNNSMAHTGYDHLETKTEDYMKPGTMQLHWALGALLHATKWPKIHITSDVQPKQKAPVLTDDKGGVGPTGWMLQREKSLAATKNWTTVHQQSSLHPRQYADWAIVPLLLQHDFISYWQFSEQCYH
jgi:hypothetical protein